MTDANIRTRLRELAALDDDWSGDGHKKPNPVALLHAAMWLWSIDGSGVAPDRITPGNCGEVFVEWGGKDGEPYRHREFDGTDPAGEYFEANI